MGPPKDIVWNTLFTLISSVFFSLHLAKSPFQGQTPGRPVLGQRRCLPASSPGLASQPSLPSGPVFPLLLALIIYHNPSPKPRVFRVPNLFFNRYLPKLCSLRAHVPKFHILHWLPWLLQAMGPQSQLAPNSGELGRARLDSGIQCPLQSVNTLRAGKYSMNKIP